MSPEGLKPSETVKDIALILGILFLSQFAFTRKVRREIIDRDGYACVICGSTSGCNCAHIDHSKDSPVYNDASNGRVLCDEHHYLDHYNREDSNIGLNKAQNRWALASIWSRLTEDKKKKLPPPK